MTIFTLFPRADKCPHKKWLDFSHFSCLRVKRLVDGTDSLIWMLPKKHCLSNSRNPRGANLPGTTVDHIKAHRGNIDLFFEPSNLQVLCKRCHDSAKQREERLGYSIEIGVDGWPVDPRNPAY